MFGLVGACADPAAQRLTTGASESAANPFTAPEGASQQTISGERQDLSAAVRWAASQQGWAVVHRAIVGERVRFELVSVRDEPGWVECSMEGSLDAPGPFSGEVRAQLGRFGDDAAQRALLRNIIRRLRALGAQGG